MPFFKNVVIPLGFFFVLLGVLVIAGAGNAVNLTDGLDGLAIVPVMIAAATFGLIAYLSGNANFARYLAKELGAPSHMSLRLGSGDHAMRIGTFPVGIETHQFTRLARRAVK